MSIVSIGEVLVDRTLLEARFSCSLESCRGACCIEGELGAPLRASEEASLKAAVEVLRNELPENQLRHIRRHGCTELYQGSLYTRTVEGRECVFVTHREGIALCAMEEAFRAGRLEDNKPLSCRLFPIRVRKKFGLDYLVYEQHHICREARKQGSVRNVPLIDYVGPALVELYGQEWYRSLKAFVDTSTER
jgi:Fe-S-cluster containining protein